MSAALTHSTPCLSDLPGAQGLQLRSATFGASARAMDIRLVSGIAPWTKMGAMELGSNPLDVKPHMSLWRTQVGPHLFGVWMAGQNVVNHWSLLEHCLGMAFFMCFFPVQTRSSADDLKSPTPLNSYMHIMQMHLYIYNYIYIYM